MQGGGVVKLKAAETTPAGLPVPRVRAHGTGASLAHVTWLTPSEGATRLSVTLETRGGSGSVSPGAKQRLLDLATTHACDTDPL